MKDSFNVNKYVQHIYWLTYFSRKQHSNHHNSTIVYTLLNAAKNL
jgi:hypothetical protein